MRSTSDIHNIQFLGSFKTIEQCPKDMLPEYAFIGRSNVGKSSFINHLVGRKQLARTSSTPGKTQSLNFFEIENNWRIVDLPGYGYARVSKKERNVWKGMIATYLRERPFLVCVFLLIDFSISPQDVDIKQAEWLAENEIPFLLLFTKSDKLKQRKHNDQLSKFIERYLDTFSSMPSYIITSAIKHRGRAQVLDRIEQINSNFQKHNE